MSSLKELADRLLGREPQPLPPPDLSRAGVVEYLERSSNRYLLVENPRPKFGQSSEPRELTVGFRGQIVKGPIFSVAFRINNQGDLYHSITLREFDPTDLTETVHTYSSAGAGRLDAHKGSGTSGVQYQVEHAAALRLTPQRYINRCLQEALQAGYYLTEDLPAQIDVSRTVDQFLERISRRDFRPPQLIP